MGTQPGPADFAQHLGEDLREGDSHLTLMSLQEQETGLPGLGRMKLLMAEEPVPVHTLVWGGIVSKALGNRIYCSIWNGPPMITSSSTA